MILQILSIGNIIVGALILRLCMNIKKVSKDQDVNNSVKWFMYAIGLEMIGNLVTAVLGAPWGVLRDALEFTVLVFILNAILHLGKYYESKETKNH